MGQEQKGGSMGAGRHAEGAVAAGGSAATIFGVLNHRVALRVVSRCTRAVVVESTVPPRQSGVHWLQLGGLPGDDGEPGRVEGEAVPAAAPFSRRWSGAVRTQRCRLDRLEGEGPDRVAVYRAQLVAVAGKIGRPQAAPGGGGTSPRCRREAGAEVADEAA